MGSDAFLLTIAQVSVTFSGFVALIGVFKTAERNMLPDERGGMRLILECSLGVVFLALLPFPLSQASGSQATTIFGLVAGPYHVLSLLLGLFLLYEVTSHSIDASRLAAAGSQPRHLKTFIFFFSLSSIVGLVEVVNGALWGIEWIYLSGLLWLLLFATMEFLAIVSKSQESTPE